MRGRVAQPLDVLVDRGVLLDVGVGLRDVRLGLVVVVVGDEVLHGVVRQHLAQLVGQLRGQRLVRGHHQRRAAAAARSARPWWPTCRCRWRRAAPRPARRRAAVAPDPRWPSAGRRPACSSLTTSNRPPCARDLAHRAELGVRHRHVRLGRAARVPLSRMPRDPGYEQPPTVSAGIGIRHGSIGPVHPPKTALFDLAAGVNVDTKGCARAVDEYRVTPFGLYMSRAMVDRPTAHWVESWLLPELGLCVTDWWWNPGHARDQDFYLDICEIEPGRGPVAAHRPLPGHRGAQPARRRGGRRRRVRRPRWPPACSARRPPRPRCTAPTGRWTASRRTATTWTPGSAGWASR